MRNASVIVLLLLLLLAFGGALSAEESEGPFAVTTVVSVSAGVGITGENLNIATFIGLDLARIQIRVAKHVGFSTSLIEWAGISLLPGDYVTKNLEQVDWVPIALSLNFVQDNVLVAPELTLYPIEIATGSPTRFRVGLAMFWDLFGSKDFERYGGGGRVQYDSKLGFLLGGEWQIGNLKF